MHHLDSQLKKRHAQEKRFRYYGIASLSLALLFLIGFFISIIAQAMPAMLQTQIQVEVYFDPALLNLPSDDPQAINQANYYHLLNQSLKNQLPDALTAPLNDHTLARRLLSTGAQYQLFETLKANPEHLNTRQTLWLQASSELAQAANDPTSAQSLQAIHTHLSQTQSIRQRPNLTIFHANDSRSAQDAGIKGALLGSLYTLLVTLSLSFPIAIFAAIYLEEFAPKNRFTDFLEANINNLAAVPSIIFGLLGLAVFIGFFGLPRSTPLVGGLVLSLMTLPTIIISSRAALKSVPPSIRTAALGLGASKMQVIFHHVLPLALPGMLTGTIIGMAQALGETAPLLMIGMVAFIAEAPNSILDPASALPVQIYLWSDLPERAFTARTALAILILLGFLILMNAIAVILRKKFERKW